MWVLIDFVHFWLFYFQPILLRNVIDRTYFKYFMVTEIF